MTRTIRRNPSQQARHQYGIGALADAVGVDPVDIGSRGVWKLNERQAERLAVSYGLHPFVVWPEMVDHVIADCSIECQWCHAGFVFLHRNELYCSKRCRVLASQSQTNDWRSDPSNRTLANERERERKRRAKADPIRAERIREQNRRASARYRRKQEAL